MARRFDPSHRVVLAEARAAQGGRAPRPRWKAPAPISAAAAAPTRLDVLVGACVAGIAAGYAELAVVAFQRGVLHQVGLGSLFINRHEGWMIPVAELAAVVPIVLACGLLARRLAPSLAGRILGVTAAAMALLGPLLAVRGLHPAAAGLLSLGVGSQVGALLERNRLGLARPPRVACLLGLVLLGGHVLVGYHTVAGHEARAWSSAPPPAPRSANILWIVMDTVRADRMSLYGYARRTTPNLERWAQRGIVFEQARSTAPWTLPSHMSMLTGLVPQAHGARIDRPYLGSSPLLSEHLQANGYATAGLVANTGCCNACFGFGRGFGRYVDHELNHVVSPFTIASSSALGRALIAAGQAGGLEIRSPAGGRKGAGRMIQLASGWLDSQREAIPERPFFLFLNFMDVHGPYRPPRTHTCQFWRGPLPPRAEMIPEWGLDAVQARTAASAVERPAHDAKVARVRRQLGDLYDDCLLYLDGELGGWLDALEAGGTLDDTWVVITSDHGEHLGELGLFGHGMSLRDELLRVPLLLIPPLKLAADEAPAQARGRRIDAMVSLGDLAATLAQHAWPEASAAVAGNSLAWTWDASRHQPAGPAAAVLAQLEAQPIDDPDAVDQRFVRTMDALFDGDHAFLRIPSSQTAGEHLYDIRQDPRQEHDLAGLPAYQARLQALGQRLDAALAESQSSRLDRVR